MTDTKTLVNRLRAYPTGATPKEAADRLEELERAIEQMRNDAATLQELHLTPGAMEATIQARPEVMEWVATCFAMMVQKSPNYTEAQFTLPREIGSRITVTVQKLTGKTPHELRMIAESENAALKETLATYNEVLEKVKDLGPIQGMSYIESLRAVIAENVALKERVRELEGESQHLRERLQAIQTGEIPEHWIKEPGALIQRNPNSIK